MNELPDAWKPLVTAEGVEYTPLPPATTLVKKLAEVMAVVERIPKRGRNDFHKYDYATEADIAATVRKELAARHIMLIPSIDKQTREPVGEKGSVLTTLCMTMEFLDGESGERIVKPWMGAGTDKEDKGLYKAITGAEKYFLLKTFLMPTGDDPEHDEKAVRVNRKATPAPPQTVVNTQTGEDVPASTRPTPPAGYRYIDACVMKDNGWCDVTFLRFNSDGSARKYSTKIPALIDLAGQAYQNGIPVHIEGKKSGNGKGDWYLNGITTWKPEPTDTQRDADIQHHELAQRASEVL
jgi:hypothetical protein